jgi:hypothetical protein
MWSLVSSMGRLLHCWWRGDRIRVSPREGRLLRLKPPCFLRIAGEPVQVTRRQVIRGAVGLTIVYHCEMATGPCELVVQPMPWGPAVTVQRPGEVRAVTAEDVDVIPGTAGKRCLKRYNL